MSRLLAPAVVLRAQEGELLIDWIKSEKALLGATPFLLDLREALSYSHNIVLTQEGVVVAHAPQLVTIELTDDLLREVLPILMLALRPRRLGQCRHTREKTELGLPRILNILGP